MHKNDNEVATCHAQSITLIKFIVHLNLSTKYLTPIAFTTIVMPPNTYPNFFILIDYTMHPITNTENILYTLQFHKQDVTLNL